MYIFRLNIVQKDDCRFSIDDNSKMNAFECLPLTHIWRRPADSAINSIYFKAFMSINAFIGWLGISVSPLCAFSSSKLQQKLLKSTATALICQFSAHNQLKRYGTIITFESPPFGSSAPIALIAFAHVIHSDSQVNCATSSEFSFVK